MADSGKEHSQIVVDLGRRTHSTTGVTGYDLLFDGNRGWNTTNEIALWLVHAAEKLSGIARQTLYITPLTFGIQGVEGQR